MIRVMKHSKKFINHPKTIGDDVISGYLQASSDILHKVEDKNVLVANDIPENKVGILTGGGLAAEPLFMGYVGEKMADCAVIGNINAAPSPFDILTGTQAIHQGKGVLYIYNNYSGDVMTFDMAKELAADEGIVVEKVSVYDNVGSATLEKITSRKGNMGVIYVLKIAGAASTKIDDIHQLKVIVEKARDNTRSLIVAGDSGFYLESGEAMFEMPPDEIEYGVGLHGEPGLFRDKIAPVDCIVEKVMGILLPDLNCKPGDSVVSMVNSMGATSISELFIINSNVNETLNKRAVSVAHNDVGFFYTSQDMVGFSITLMKLDEELLTYFQEPTKSFSYQYD
jgi:phosphoenolpyruvate---glycerone phosphotransferase subunit DhaK